MTLLPVVGGGAWERFSAEVPGPFRAWWERDLPYEAEPWTRPHEERPPGPPGAGRSTGRVCGTRFEGGRSPAPAGNLVIAVSSTELSDLTKPMLHYKSGQLLYDREGVVQHASSPPPSSRWRVQGREVAREGEGLHSRSAKLRAFP